MLKAVPKTELEYNNLLEDGVKHDQSKRDWLLLAPLFPQLEKVIQTMEFGEKKYARDNWKNVQPKSRYTNALIRHVMAYAGGEQNDPESGIHHLAHAIFCALCRMWGDDACVTEVKKPGEMFDPCTRPTRDCKYRITGYKVAYCRKEDECQYDVPIPINKPLCQYEDCPGNFRKITTIGTAVCFNDKAPCPFAGEQ
jgi:hypothetical protein